MNLVKIAVKNLGPVKQAEIELKPLTIFIGPNNTGKSYLAYTIYALARNSVDQLKWRAELDKVLNNMWKSRQKAARLDIKLFFKMLQEEKKKVRNRLVSDFYKAMFGVSFKQSGKEKVEIDAEIEDPVNEAALKETEFDSSFFFESATISYSKLKGDSFVSLTVKGRKPRRKITYEWELDQFARILKDALLSQVRKVVLLPAERQIRRELVYIGLHDTKPIFLDALEDLKNFLSRCRFKSRNSSPFEPEIAYIEEMIYRGGRLEQTGIAEEFSFRVSDRLPAIDLVATGSGVLSTAPLVILLKRLLVPGDMVILDEPEANLYPEAQVFMANALCMLVNRGLRVLITTHSPYILSQIDNLILAEQKARNERIRELLQQYRIPEQALIHADKVAVYVFNTDGSVKSGVSEGIIDEASFALASDAVESFYQELNALEDES